MNDNLEKEIYKIVSKTFNIPISDITLETGPSDIVLWDSLGQLNIVSTLEQHFSIVFDYEELFQIVSVDSIISIVRLKLNEK